MVLAKDKFSLNAATENILKTVLETVQSYLQTFANDSNFTAKMQVAFGDRINIIDLHKTWKSGDFSSFPLIEILPANEINGANGAFAAATNTIYLAQEYISQNINNPDAIVDVLLEEFGHGVDAWLNASDSPGDEGAIFSALVQGKSIDGYQLEQLKGEDDTVIATLDGQLIEIEQATTGFVSGGFEGSRKILKLDSKGGGTANYFYEMYRIPDQFILRYEGKEILNTGFVSGDATGQVQIPKGNSDELEVILATNDEGTAWDYSVTTKGSPDTTPFLIELASGGQFEDIDGDGDVDGQGTIYIGRTDGISRMLRVENATAEYDSNSLRITGGTVFSEIGTGDVITKPLFQGDFEIPFNTGATSSLREAGSLLDEYKVAGLNIDFSSFTIYPYEVVFGSDFKLPVELGGFDIRLASPNALIVRENDINFSQNLKFSLPPFEDFELFNNLKIKEFSDVSLEYIASENKLKIQGKLTLDIPTNSLKINEVTADLSGDNFIQITPDANGDGFPEVGLKGTLNIAGNLPLGKKLRLKEVQLSWDNIDKIFGGGATFQILPKGIEIGGGVEFTYDPFDLKFLAGSVDNLNKPIRIPIFFQGGSAEIDNLFPIRRLSDESGLPGVDIKLNGKFTYLPQLLIPIELDVPMLGISKSVSSIAELNAGLNINFGDSLDSLSGKGELKVLGGLARSQSIEISQNLKDQVTTITGKISGINNLFQSTGVIKLTQQGFTFSRDAVISFPKSIPFLGNEADASLSGNVLLSFTNDDNISNDYLAVWGKLEVDKLGILPDSNITFGIKVFLDGKTELLSKELPQTNSVLVPPNTQWIMMSVDWENSNNNVPVQVKTPNGTFIQESDFAANNIAIIDEFTDSTTKTVIVLNPQQGIWDLNVVDATGLGKLEFIGFKDSVAPTVDLTAPSVDVGGGEVTINYNAFDSDSDAEVSLFYDTDNEDFDGILIADNIAETDGAGSFVWNTEGMATGDYFVYAMVMDENNAPVFDYAEGKVSITEEADLSVTQTANTNSVGIGENFTYTVTVTNNGSIESKGVTLIETLPEEVTFVSASVTPSEQSDNTLTFNLDNLASSATETIDITVTAPTTEGNITGSALVTSDTFDPDATNDVDILTTTVEEIPPEPVDLSIARTDNPDPINLGENFTYTLTIANNGSGGATGVVVTENLPSGINFVDVTTSQGNAFQDFNGKVIANLDNIKSGEEATVTITVNPFAAGNLVATTSVASNETEQDITNNFLIQAQAVNPVIPADADLELTQIVDNANPNIGDQVTFSLTLTNKGPGTASSIKVTDLLPTGLSFVSATPEQGTYDSSTGVWDVGNMRDNLSRTLDIIANVETTGAITTTAEITAVTETDPDSTPNNNDPNEDDQASVTLNSSNSTSFSLTKNDTNIFTIEGSSGIAQLKATVSEQNASFVNEVGIFNVDDDLGTINGITPGQEDYQQAALERAKAIFSALPDAQGLTNPARQLSFDAGDRLVFYMVENSTTDAVLAGNSANVLFGSTFSNANNFEQLKVSDNGEGVFSLAWEDQQGGSDKDYDDLLMTVELTNDPAPVGTELQGNPQNELIDLSNVTGQVSVSVEVHREAAFDNLIGFYQVVDSKGGIDTNGDGVVDFNPGDTGYEEAALTNRITGLDLLQTDNQQTSTFNGTFEGGSILAPFIVVDGTVDEAINGTKETYFSFLGANEDKVDHIRLLGDNTFGFEDLYGGGDNDFNDMILQIKFPTV